MIEYAVFFWVAIIGGVGWSGLTGILLAIWLHNQMLRLEKEPINKPISQPEPATKPNTMELSASEHSKLRRLESENERLKRENRMLSVANTEYLALKQQYYNLSASCKRQQEMFEHSPYNELKKRNAELEYRLMRVIRTRNREHVRRLRAEPHEAHIEIARLRNLLHTYNPTGL